MYKQILGGILAVSVAFGASDSNTAEASFSKNINKGDKLIAFMNNEEVKQVAKETIPATNTSSGLAKFEALSKINADIETKKVTPTVKAEVKSKVVKSEAVKASEIKQKQVAFVDKDVNGTVTAVAEKTKPKETITPDSIGESVVEMQNKITETVGNLNEVSSDNDLIPKLEEVNSLPPVLENLKDINPMNFESTDISDLTSELTLKSEQVVRTDASEDSNIVAFTPETTSVEILEEKTEDGWYKVKYEVDVAVEKEGKGKSQKQEYVGYIHLDYIPVVDETEEEEVKSNAELVKTEIEQNLLSEIDKEIELERKAKEEAERQAKLAAERKARIEAQQEAERQERARAQVQSRQTGGQSNASSQSQSQQSAPKQAIQSNSSNGGSSSIMGQATRYLGTPYVYGSSPSTTRSFDCSSYTQRVFSSLGINLPRTSSAQAGVGTTVSRANLQVGDLVFFTTNGRGTVSHVGIYAGNGKFIGAQTSGGVSYGNMNDSYWGPKYITAKRVR